EELRDLARGSNTILRELGPGIQWVESYLLRDRMYCVYIAEDQALLREHALRGGFPADQISRVVGRLDPTSGE
ncbi:MAG TPA: DUF4242 domain-containing protein, partial [Gemmatimonadales bacterium]|nr:DUF4242 domain-containing protein [Gemmatimonadales bacterium]